MIENLTAYLTLNDIEPAQSYLSAGEIILKNLDKKIVPLARKSFILQGFQDFSSGKITLEEFMLMGDEGSKTPLYGDTQIDDVTVYLETLLRLDLQALTESIVLVDEQVSSAVQKQLERRGSVLLSLG